MPSGLLFGVEIAFSSYERAQQGCGANRTQQEDRAHRAKPHQSQMALTSPPTAEPTAMPMLNDMELSDAARFNDPGCD